MNGTRLGLMALLASAAAIGGCTSDATAPSAMARNALARGVPASATAAANPATVGNFMLVDANMEAHELYRLADAKAVVIVTQSNGDAVLRGRPAT